MFTNDLYYPDFNDKMLRGGDVVFTTEYNT